MTYDINLYRSASSLGLPLLHPYLDSLGADFSRGANFANILFTIALSTSNTIPTARRPRGTNLISLDIQIAQFAQFVTGSQTQEKIFKKLMPKKKYFAKALYTLDICQVDITAEVLDNKTDDEIKAIVPDLINRGTGMPDLTLSIFIVVSGIVEPAQTFIVGNEDGKGERGNDAVVDVDSDGEDKGDNY
ncbi:hypothetical protein POM88_036966 [Heracleum sosnowskyi]|uniref:Uncharacterized protein n=1 Tax=Heracleum sosnowskyi TaxID=360622 RepID=A0AAD8HQS4_9APIA|nr:hypothetical protein POM88_036966 [Heracleum sosnowskyi]